ncbi:MAG: glycosyltransferase [Chloroflexi bacterium]|nr:glycosyltransferase [Chloroflexota bacterium]
MTDNFIGFVLFWGVWLFVPMLIDGVTAAAYFIGAFRSRPGARPRHEEAELTYYPIVSIVIPVHNGADVLASCLESIRNQSYPHDRIEVLVVDNVSTDTTREIFFEEQQKPFSGLCHWISLPYKGKPGALNAGIHRVRGDVICNIDADTVLDKDAILAMVRGFELDPMLAAATGVVEVLPLGPEYRSPLRYITAEAEFLEYYTGFRIGRQYQSQTGSLFTLAGAFSGFRREVLLRTFLYDDRTVSEDTSLTFFVARAFPEMRVRCLPDAVAYVEPTEGFRRLYAQRVRWQRGQLEVASLFPEFERHPFRIRGLSLPKSLLVDHTLAFPRVVWTFLLPMLYFVGYPLALVVSATLSMYLIYMGVDALYIVVAHALAEGEAKARIRRHWWMFLFMPAYRWTTFWFRFGGFLSVLMESKTWRVDDPVTETRQSLNRMSTAMLTFVTRSLLPRVIALFGGLVRPR